MRRLPSLNALKAFETAARMGSISRAADELHVTQSAVSRQIRQLEEEMGLTLFRRVHRGIALTPDGRVLAESLTSSFRAITETVERLTLDRNAVRLRVLPTVGVRWLWPRLKRFESRYPDLRLQVDVLWHSLEPGDAGHDMGVRYGTGSWADEDAELLLPERLTPVCSPAFLDQKGVPRSAAAFARAPLLHSSLDHADWRTWSRGWRGGPFDVDHGVDFDMQDMALRAAENSRGIAMADLVMAVDDIKATRLVAPYRDVVRSGGGHFLVIHRTARDRPAVQAVRNWLIAEASGSVYSLAPVDHDGKHDRTPRGRPEPEIDGETGSPGGRGGR